MATAKDIVIKPISPADANAVIKRIHYSGKVVPNSQLHFGVFLNGICDGALQFGPSMVKRLIIGLVKDTKWNGFIELNRMALGPSLPKNSESRAIAICLKIIKKNYPHIEWVISFADGTQCGDGTIYRASGFVLTGIKKNTGLRRNPITGEVMQQITAHHNLIRKEFSTWDALPGYQFRYIYFLNKQAKDRLTVPILNFSEITKKDAGMYLGKKRAASIDNDASGFQSEEGGATPTAALQPK